MAISSLASDLDDVLKHVGVVVTIGAVNSYGQLKKEAIEVQSESGALKVVGTKITLKVREGTFSGLGQDVAVTADGNSYRIRDIGKPLPDGSRMLELVEASP